LQATASVKEDHRLPLHLKPFFLDPISDKNKKL
jgi:hypothetical protein